MLKTKLYVGNLNYALSKQELSGIIAEKFEVVDLKLFEGKGFAIVEFSSEENAEKAIEFLNGKEIAGRQMRVDFAKPPQKKSFGDRPRSFGGGGRDSRGGGGRDRDRSRSRY